MLAGGLPAGRPLVGSSMEMLTGGIVLTGLAAATGELTHIDPAHVSTQSLLGLLYLIGPGSLLALTCYVIALRRLPTAAVSTYAYVNPVVAVSLGALFLGERPRSPRCSAARSWSPASRSSSSTAPEARRRREPSVNNRVSHTRA